ncbi:MAG: dihydroxyacetone kinase subunit DhaK [Caldilineaceae bacterium]
MTQRAHPQLLKVNFDPAFVVRADAPIAGKVGIVSGGGGHEPLHGQLCGPRHADGLSRRRLYFADARPDPRPRAVDGGAGVLYIVKNYTGDVMNFDIAAELVADDGIEVASVVIDDDVAVENSIYTAGRHGVGATVTAGRFGAAAGRRPAAGPRRQPLPPGQ